MNKLSGLPDGYNTDPRLTHFIAMGVDRHSIVWGRGRTFRLAIQNMHGNDGERPKRFTVHAVSKDTYVRDDGALCRPQGDPAPVEVKALDQSAKSAEAQALLAGF